MPGIVAVASDTEEISRRPGWGRRRRRHDGDNGGRRQWPGRPGVVRTVGWRWNIELQEREHAVPEAATAAEVVGVVGVGVGVAVVESE
jgi:hypothetical protein